MTLQKCFDKFLEQLDISLLQMLKTLLNMMLTMISQMILTASLDLLRFGKDLAVAQALLSIIEGVYGAVLSTVDVLGEFIKQFDYCESVGDFSTIVKNVINENIGPFTKVARDVREYLMFQKLKEAEINSLNEYKEKIQAMIDKIDIEIARRLS